MGRATDQIADQLASQRSELKANLAELGDKVKSATDWREQFRNHPGAFLATAIGGGVLLAALTKGSHGRPSRTAANASTSASPSSALEAERSPPHEGWDTIKRALIGLAAAKFKGVVGEVIPGFSEQLERVEAEKAQRPAATNLRAH